MNTDNRPLMQEAELIALRGSAPASKSQEAKQGLTAASKQAQHDWMETSDDSMRSRSLSSVRPYSLQLMGIVSLAVVASIALGAHYTFSKPEPVVITPKPEWTPIPDRPQVVEEEEEAAPPPPPTLYRNPFDKNEVFELPPGLTKEEARDMVAQILMERARERVAP